MSAPSSQPALAGFGRRLLASALDWLPLLAAVLFFTRLAGHGPPPPVALSLVVYLLYNGVYRPASGTRSWGKAVMGLRLVRGDGSPLGRGRCLLRFALHVALLVLGLRTHGLLLLGFIWALWDPRRQAWHDKLLDTIVVGPDAPAAAVGASSPPGGDVGRVVGKYLVTRRVGEGGMGEVFEALHQQLNRRVALKRMRPEISQSARDKARFLKEARTVAELRHPNIIEIYDILEEADGLYLVFEFVPGRTVAAWLDEKGTLAWVDALQVMRAACDALDYAHRRRIVHRDLKPSNIMVSRGERVAVKVMDFGIAREVKDTLSRLGTTDTSGTLPYMSPEQHLGTVDPTSDLYSLGVNFYEMLTGELPFRGPDFLAQKERLVYRPLSGLRPDVPKGVDALLHSCLQPRKEQRMPTAAALWDALVRLAA